MDIIIYECYVLGIDSENEIKLGLTSYDSAFNRYLQCSYFSRFISLEYFIIQTIGQNKELFSTRNVRNLSYGNRLYLIEASDSFLFLYKCPK